MKLLRLFGSLFTSLDYFAEAVRVQINEQETGEGEKEQCLDDHVSGVGDTAIYTGSRGSEGSTD